MSIEVTGAKILLKARPTPAQLRDRLAAPRPDRLELYLDARDITDPNPHSDGLVPWLRAIMVEAAR